MAHETKLACVAWRFCRAGRTAKPRAAKFARKARENERRSREKNKNKLLPPQSPLTKLAPIVTQPGLFLWRVFFVSKSLKVNVFASNNF